ncbi:hypothetical protein QAD02_012013 [Eretmocerus hayati]|uniref:Uncharacterized protein n=1 Tax=Eretmocerus hayati TaxID=131215 RepID=A0ACC2P1A3_9HYME|nr:hypothetical protein QAD02_012013 [Eretmocerus hayati]
MAHSVRLDIDPVIICPYDKNHKIAQSRIQRHLTKCERNFPPDYKQQCPYDATHRVFEHEMIDHVENCPRKLIAPISSMNQGIAKLPEIDSELESKMDDDELWEEGNTSTSIKFSEPEFNPSKVKQYTNMSMRGNALIAKRFGSKLRQPFGFSVSMMLDTTNPETDDDDDDRVSVSSDMGYGRGSGFLKTASGPITRGVRGNYRRGVRGRLLH